MKILVRLQKGTCNVARVKWPLFDRVIMQTRRVNRWNSHAGLAPEASNIPNEIQVLNWGLIWSFHCSSDEQIIEMITEIKSAIIKLSIHSWEESSPRHDIYQEDGWFEAVEERREFHHAASAVFFFSKMVAKFRYQQGDLSELDITAAEDQQQMDVTRQAILQEYSCGVHLYIQRKATEAAHHCYASYCKRLLWHSNGRL